MKKSLPKQSQTSFQDLIVYQPATIVGTKRDRRGFFVRTRMNETTDVFNLIETSPDTRTVAVRRERRGFKLVAGQVDVVVKRLGTYAVPFEVNREGPFSGSYLIHYTHKAFPLTRAERKKAALALVSYAKERSVFLSLSLAMTFVRIYETSHEGSQYFMRYGRIYKGVNETGPVTETVYTGTLPNRPVWISVAVQRMFQNMQWLYINGPQALEDEIESLTTQTRH